MAWLQSAYVFRVTVCRIRREAASDESASGLDGFQIAAWAFPLSFCSLAV